MKFTPSPAASPLSTCPGPGIRVDSHAYTVISFRPINDSLIGKIIATATRASRRSQAHIALSETVIEGIKTNIPLHQDLILDAAFLRGGRASLSREKLAKLASSDFILVFNVSVY